MNNRIMARADLVTGALLFVLAVASVAASWTMDRLEARRIHPFSAPGVTPGLLGLALGVASLLLIVKAVRDGGARRRAAGEPGVPFADAAAIRLGATLFLCLGYSLVLIGLIPYWLATAIFVSAFILIFEWSDPGSRPAKFAWALGVGLAIGLGVSYAFSEIFLVRLP